MKGLFASTALGAFGLLFFACQSPDTSASDKSTTASATPATETAGTKPDLFLYVVNVENLRLRDQPNLNAATIGQLKECELVEGTGQASANKEEVELRGVSISAPYLEVRMVSPEPRTAWAFGGALTPVYAGSKAGAPNSSALVSLAQYLKTLDPKKVESGGAAWNYVVTNLSSATGSTADGVFFILEHFLCGMENDGAFYTLTEAVKWTDSDMQAVYEDRFDARKYPETDRLNKNGFRLVTGEGMVFPVVDWRKYQSFFGNKVSPALKAYISQNTQEQSHPMFSEGGALVPLNQVADVAALWERFNRENPYFPKGEETVESERWLRLILINGADNTPIFDYESGQVIEEVKNAWTYIQEKYPNTKLSAEVKQMSDLCKAEGGKRTPKVEAFQAELLEEYNKR